jgi:hypothetical protein
MLQGHTGPHTHELARALRDEAASISRARLWLAEIAFRNRRERDA